MHASLLCQAITPTLPAHKRAGLVLCPGNTLPLRLTFRGDRALVQQALSAPPPLSRLIAVVCCTRSYFTPQLMLQRWVGSPARQPSCCTLPCMLQAADHGPGATQACLPGVRRLLGAMRFPSHLPAAAGWGAWLRYGRWAAAASTFWPRVCGVAKGGGSVEGKWRQWAAAHVHACVYWPGCPRAGCLPAPLCGSQGQSVSRAPLHCRTAAGGGAAGGGCGGQPQPLLRASQVGWRRAAGHPVL